ncbi:MAG: hypothetical protein J6O61_12060 [Butyrivibrio sp.]|uniref:hypothetical protein n=1 Tax=Butyrivibrio sp. TaxID=28121 RepID=UPI001B1E8D8A|nr:hypothetical protein [Butyrivibrio sp.]MBO6241551.1 hypothetical protein [Butyrivibrio sp.]
MKKSRQLTFLETLYSLNSNDSSEKTSAYNEFCAAAYHYAITVMTPLQSINSTLLHHLACSAEDLACEFAMSLINNRKKLLKVYDSALYLGENGAEVKLKAYIKTLKNNFLTSKFREVSHKEKVTTTNKVTGEKEIKEVWVYNYQSITSLDSPAFENADSSNYATKAELIPDTSIDIDYSYLTTREAASIALSILSPKEQFAFIKDMLGLKNSHLSQEIETSGYLRTYQKMLLQFANSPLLKGDDDIIECYYNRYVPLDFETSLTPSRFISKYSTIYKTTLAKYLKKEKTLAK